MLCNHSSVHDELLNKWIYKWVCFRRAYGAGSALHAAQCREEPEAAVARHEHRGDRGDPAGRPAHHAALRRAARQRPLLRVRERQVRRLRYPPPVPSAHCPPPASDVLPTSFAIAIVPSTSANHSMRRAQPQASAASPFALCSAL